MLPGQATLGNYGGVKVDYAPSVNGATDRDATPVNQAFQDVAAMTLTSVRAYVAWYYASSTVTIVSCNAEWGNTPPTITRTSTGVYTVTWPTTITDDLGNVVPVVMYHGWGTLEGAIQQYCSPQMTSPNVATAFCWNSSGAVDPGSTSNAVIWVL